MNSRLRFSIVIVLTLAFAIIAPLVILGTAGYRYNWKKGRPEMTGVIKLDSRPTDAAISLNGKDQVASTPYSIFRLLPGSYEIGLSKPGYYSWSKTMAVRSGETIFTDTVPLFRQSEPERLGKISQAVVASFSPDETMIGAVVADGKRRQLVIMDRDGGNMDAFVTLETADETKRDNWRLDWSPSADWLLVAHQTDGLWQATAFPLYGERQKSYRPLSAFLPTGTKLLNWRWQTDSDRLVAQTNRGVYLIEPTSRTARILTAASVTDVAVVKDQMYLLSSDRNGLVRLSVTATNDPNGGTALAHLPVGRYHFTEIGPRALTLTEQRTNTGYMYDLASAKLHGPWSATRVSWQKKGQNGRFLLWNDYEIYALNASSEPEMLLRVGVPLLGCAWHTSGRAIFYATKEKIMATELDNRDRRNAYTLMTPTETYAVSFFGSGKVIRVIGQWQNQFGLYAIGY